MRKNNFNSAGAIVLGMHDALVSLTGLIAGLAVAMADRYAIYSDGDYRIYYRQFIYGRVQLSGCACKRQCARNCCSPVYRRRIYGDVCGVDITFLCLYKSRN